MSSLCVLCAGCGVCVAVWMCWCPVSNVSPCWWPHWDRDYFQSVSIHSSGSHQQTPPVIAWSPGHSQAKINYHFISHPSMRWHSTTRNKAWKLLGEREKIITKSGEKLDNSTSECVWMRPKLLLQSSGPCLSTSSGAMGESWLIGTSSIVKSPWLML